MLEKECITMALAVKDKIQTTDIITKFTNDVKRIILNGAYHSGNIPFCGSYQCIPTEMLGNIDALPDPKNVGTEGNQITAQNIYNALVEVTQILTCVGTFSYVRRLQTDSGYQVTGTLSGKALFKPEYAKALPTVQNTEVLPGHAITVHSINQLVGNCLTAWNNATKYHYPKTVDYCHSSCHSNCHSDCHSDCHTHACYMNGRCHESDGCWDGKCYN